MDHEIVSKDLMDAIDKERVQCAGTQPATHARLDACQIELEKRLQRAKSEIVKVGVQEAASLKTTTGA